VTATVLKRFHIEIDLHNIHWQLSTAAKSLFSLSTSKSTLVTLQVTRSLTLIMNSNTLTRPILSPPPNHPVHPPNQLSAYIDAFLHCDDHCHPFLKGHRSWFSEYALPHSRLSSNTTDFLSLCTGIATGNSSSNTDREFKHLSLATHIFGQFAEAK
jgi:hypothetical protein